MNSTSIVTYEPLVEVEDFRGRKYYTKLSVAELEKLMDANERVFFPFSNRGVRVSQIVNWGPADPETVAIETEIQSLTDSQKRTFEASKKIFLDFWNGAKPITNEMIQRMVVLARE